MANYDGEMYGEPVTFTFYSGGQTNLGWYVIENGVALRRVQLADVARGVADPSPPMTEHRDYMRNLFSQYKQYIQNLDMTQTIDEDQFARRASTIAGLYNELVDAKTVVEQ